MYMPINRLAPLMYACTHTFARLVHIYVSPDEGTTRGQPRDPQVYTLDDPHFAIEFNTECGETFEESELHLRTLLQISRPLCKRGALYVGSV